MQNLVLSPVAVPELVNLIATEIETRMLNREKPHKKNEPRYLSRKETAELLRITLPTLNEQTKRGKLAAYRIGGRVLYREDEIQNCLNQVVTKKI